MILEIKYECWDYHAKRKHIVYDFYVTNPKTALSLGKIERLLLNMTFELNSLRKKPSFWPWDLFCKLSTSFTEISGCWEQERSPERYIGSLSVFNITSYLHLAILPMLFLHNGFTCNFSTMNYWLDLAISQSILGSSVFTSVKWHCQSACWMHLSPTLNLDHIALLFLLSVKEWLLIMTTIQRLVAK